ncbi:hypothetical protein HK405_004482 [Cladochytrium tenue]|nr:hypothetical protein HK405_004482 [Cladochytrium tenue]
MPASQPATTPTAMSLARFPLELLTAILDLVARDDEADDDDGDDDDDDGYARGADAADFYAAGSPAEDGLWRADVRLRAGRGLRPSRIDAAAASTLLECALVCKASPPFFAAAMSVLWYRRVVVSGSTDWDRLRPLVLRPQRLYCDYRKLIHEFVIRTSSARSLTSDTRPMGGIPSTSRSPFRRLSGDLPGPPAKLPSLTQPSGDTRMQGLPRLLHACAALTVLRVDAPALNDDDLWIIAPACRHLHTLSLLSAPIPHARISDEGIVAVATHCPHLRSIAVRAHGRAAAAAFSDRGIDALAAAYPGRLRTFALEWVDAAAAGPEATGGGLAVASPRRLSPAALRNTDFNGRPPNLPSSTATASSPPHPTAAGDDPEADARFTRSLVALIAANPDMRALALHWPVGVEPALLAASRHLSHLIALRVGGLPSRHPLPLTADASPAAAIGAVLAANLGLRSLRLSDLGLGPDGLRQVVDYCVRRAAHNRKRAATAAAAAAAAAATRMHGAELAEPAAVTQVDIEAGPAVEPLAALTTLDLDGVGFLSATLAELAAPRFGNLTRLRVSPSRLSASVPFAAADAAAAVALRNMPRLRALALPVGGAAPLQALADACPRLVRLDAAAGPPAASAAAAAAGALLLGDDADDAIAALASGCPRLAALRIGPAAVGVGDSTLRVLAAGLGGCLTRLALPARGCGVSLAGVRELASACGPRLRVLENVPVRADGGGTDVHSVVDSAAEPPRMGDVASVLAPLLPRLRRLSLLPVGGGGAFAAADTAALEKVRAAFAAQRCRVEMLLPPPPPPM